MFVFSVCNWWLQFLFCWLLCLYLLASVFDGFVLLASLVVVLGSVFVLLVVFVLFVFDGFSICICWPCFVGFVVSISFVVSICRLSVSICCIGVLFAGFRV